MKTCKKLLSLFLILQLLDVLGVKIIGCDKNLNINERHEFGHSFNVKKKIPLFKEAVAMNEDDNESETTNNYGVLRYDYTYRNAIPDVNLGDYIQSLAAMQFLPKNCKPIFVNRDALKLYDGPKIKLLMNCWYFLNKDNEVLSDKINPLYVSFHINNEDALSPCTINDLKKHQPIGCRDYNTQRMLRKRGIDAYFSSCLTTTLDMNYKISEDQRTKDIIFCDYKFGDYIEADKYLQTLDNYDFNNIRFVTHSFSKDSTHEKRFDEARKLLNIYAKAKLVVTTRIHCALPCLALGTPVIFIKKWYDHRRFKGLYELLNTIGKNQDGKFRINVRKDINGYILNPMSYLRYSNKLKKYITKEF